MLPNHFVRSLPVLFAKLVGKTRFVQNINSDEGIVRFEGFDHILNTFQVVVDVSGSFVLFGGVYRQIDSDT